MKALTAICNFLGRLSAGAVISLVQCYRICISPMLGPHCRFQPTCSEYFIESVRKYGVLRGSLRGFWRICRCHPFSSGGHDPP